MSGPPGKPLIRLELMGPVAPAPQLAQIRSLIQEGPTMPAPQPEADLTVGAAAALDAATRERIEAAAFRKLVEHLRGRTDVQNIDLMNLSGFCRNCLSRWWQEAAGDAGVAVETPAAREVIYGMPYKDWQAQHQAEASAEQKAKFAVANPSH